MQEAGQDICHISHCHLRACLVFEGVPSLGATAALAHTLTILLCRWCGLRTVLVYVCCSIIFFLRWCLLGV